MMLIFFPTPYPDELLYSIVARYHLWSCNTTYKSTMKELFGTHSIHHAADFPQGLKYLHSQLSSNTLLTPEKLIYNHTLFPLYEPFSPLGRSENILLSMNSSRENGIHNKIGVMGNSIPTPRFLKYCFTCVMNDRELYGEEYWHRSHQVFGVNICPKHFERLIESNVEFSYQRNGHKCTALSEVAKSNKSHQKICLTEELLEHEKALSQGVYWLLNNKLMIYGWDEIRNRYLHYLGKYNLVTNSNRVHQKKLMEEFKLFYGTEFLKELKSDIDEKKTDNWLNKLFRKARSSIHPIRHILTMRFLGINLEQFFHENITGANKKDRPFGKGPWPCLNPFSLHFKENKVEICQVKKHHKLNIPVGIFSCSCGFSYYRSGPDVEEKDRLKYDQIKSFGIVWEKSIREFSQHGLSLREIARRAGVDPHTIKKHLKGKENEYTINSHKQRQFLQQRKRHRIKWIELIKTYPSKTKKELRELASASYMWLYKNDKEWLKGNSPGRGEYRNGGNRTDWNLRDENLHAKVLECVENIRNENEKPVRITLNLIKKKTGELSLLHKHLDKMPKTKKVIKDIIETTEDFQIRRIRYVIEKMKEENVEICEWKIIRLAGIKEDFYRGIKDKI